MSEGTVNYPPYTVAWANTQSRIFRSFPFQTREQAIDWAKSKVMSHFNPVSQTVYLITPDHQFKPLSAADLGVTMEQIEQYQSSMQQNWEDEDDEYEDNDE